MKAFAVAWLAAAAIAGGCASYSGSSLIAGKSDVQEIERTMGTPALKLPGPGGESVWIYSRGPAGWHVYAVRVGPDGIMRGIEQRLTTENVRKIVPEKWKKQDVLELLGPPFQVTSLRLKPREVWEYQFLEVEFKWILWIQFSDDGVVREVLQMRHPEMDPPGDVGDFP